MLPKENRLPALEIRNVLRSKERVSSQEFQIVFTKNNRSFSRFAVIVSNSIDKRATIRNRTRRLARESIRRLVSKMILGIDAIFIARQSFANKTQNEVQEHLEKLLTHAGILKNS